MKRAGFWLSYSQGKSVYRMPVGWARSETHCQRLVLIKIVSPPSSTQYPVFMWWCHWKVWDISPGYEADCRDTWHLISSWHGVVLGWEHPNGGTTAGWRCHRNIAVPSQCWKRSRHYYNVAFQQTQSLHGQFCESLLKPNFPNILKIVKIPR